MNTFQKALLSVVLATLACATPAVAQQASSGIVAKVDEPAGTVTIEASRTATVGSTGSGSRTEDYRLQDGLIFNALREGDAVSFESEMINGAKTITKLIRR